MPRHRDEDLDKRPLRRRHEGQGYDRRAPARRDIPLFEEDPEDAGYRPDEDLGSRERDPFTLDPESRESRGRARVEADEEEPGLRAPGDRRRPFASIDPELSRWGEPDKEQPRRGARRRSTRDSR